MNPADRRKWMLLFVLLTILFASLYAAFVPDGKSSSTRASQTIPPASAADDVPNMNLLKQEIPPVFVQVQRNVFEFKEEQPPPQPTAAQISRPGLNTSSIPESTLPEVQYLGYYLEKDGAKLRLAAISNSGKIYVGRVGQVLGGKYQLIQIEDEFLILKYLPENKIIRLPLGKTSPPVEEKNFPLADMQ